MDWQTKYLWLVAVVPLLASGIIHLLGQRRRALGPALAIGAVGFAFIYSLFAFVITIRKPSATDLWRQTVEIPWLQIGNSTVSLGWLLDPLTSSMLVMVTGVSLMVFIYSIAYMHEDERMVRFFGHLSLFVSAMLGLIIANNLLLLFMCWELVGVASYFLIGFWYEKLSACAAAQKAFITTRVADLGMLIGLLWLYHQTGTLTMYANGAGCLDRGALQMLSGRTLSYGLTFAGAIALLLFVGAMGKSGQFPLHVWLPDAMEGPTPVSALIHAATMVAAGVFLMARVFPLIDPNGIGTAASAAGQIIAWTGAITAMFAALAATAQTDIKRILAYSTISQLGYMMLSLGIGGPTLAVFHLITHGFFKALLFLGAGSVIHGLGGEQDIRKMGGLARRMKITFVLYAIGMLALTGFPFAFSGFWSKDAILHEAHIWNGGHGPFWLGLCAAGLTAFYMTRQVTLVFFVEPEHAAHYHPHESPATMWLPMALLAIPAIFAGFAATPGYPWLTEFLQGNEPVKHLRLMIQPEFLKMVATSTAIVFAGYTIGYLGYRKFRTEGDPLALRYPLFYESATAGFRLDAFYEKTVIAWTKGLGRLGGWVDHWIFDSLILALGYLNVGLGFVARLFDDYVIHPVFKGISAEAKKGGQQMTRLQNGRLQSYIQILGFLLGALALYSAWGGWR